MWKLFQKKMNELFEKNWLSAIFLEIISIYSFWAGEKLATGLKLHQVKAFPKVDEWVIWEKLAISYTFRDNSHLSFWVGEKLAMGLKLHHVKALPKVDEWVIWEKLAICNTFRDNLHLLILSRWVISYGRETSPSESSPKSRWMTYLRKIGYLQFF